MTLDWHDLFHTQAVLRSRFESWPVDAPSTSLSTPLARIMTAPRRRLIGADVDDVAVSFAADYKQAPRMQCSSYSSQAVDSTATHDRLRRADSPGASRGLPTSRLVSRGFKIADGAMKKKRLLQVDNMRRISAAMIAYDSPISCRRSRVLLAIGCWAEEGDIMPPFERLRILARPRDTLEVISRRADSIFFSIDISRRFALAPSVTQRGADAAHCNTASVGPPRALFQSHRSRSAEAENYAAAYFDD